MPTLLPSGKQSFDTSAGLPLVGGRLYTYDAGTNTPRATYADSAGTTPNANPVILDARGEATIFWSGSYKVVLKDAADVTIWTVDNVRGVDAGDLSSTTSATGGAGLIGFSYGQAYGAGTLGKWLKDLALAAGSTFIGWASSLAGSVTRTVSAKLNDSVCIFDFLTTAQIADVTSNTASIDLTAIIQGAMDQNDDIWFPVGTYKLTSALNLNDNQVIRCASRRTIFKGGYAGAIFQGKNGTTVRRFSGAIYSGKLTHTTRITAGSIGLDFKSLSMFKVYGTLIQEVETGVKNGGVGSLGAFYNEFHAVDISGVVTGYDNGTLGNDNKVFGGRVNDSVTGTRDNDNSGNTYYSLSCETFTTRGHLNADTTATTNIKYIASRLENPPTVGIGFDIRALAQVCMYIYPQFVGLTTNISDASATKDTNGFSDAGLVVKSSPPIKGFGYAKVTRDVASLAANTFRQEGPITVTGARIGDAITVSPFAAWPNNMHIGAAWATANDTVFFNLLNTSGAPIDPPSGDFAFSWVRG